MKSGVRVFDISADFRLRSTAKYKEYYGKEHPAPELLKQAREEFSENAAEGYDCPIGPEVVPSAQ